MAGSILGADQVARINTAYPRLLRHIGELVSVDNSPYGLMKVHFLTEFLDTTELASIFMGLSFLAPAEKRALVRAAIFDVLRKDDRHFYSLDNGTSSGYQTHGAVTSSVPLKTFTPPQFNLNVTTVEALKEEKAPAEDPLDRPVPSVLKKVQDLRDDAKEKHSIAQAEREAVVAEIRKPEESTKEVTGFKADEVA